MEKVFTEVVFILGVFAQLQSKKAPTKIDNINKYFELYHAFIYNFGVKIYRYSQYIY